MGKSASSDPRSGAMPKPGAAEPPCSHPPVVELQFPSCSEYLALIRPTARWFAKKCGFAERDTARIVLATVEAVTNIIRHAYGGDARQRITLRMTEIGGGLEIEFLDQGKSVTPADIERRSAAKSTHPETGGLGVKMMKTCMDHFEYEPLPGGGARLLLRKLRGSPFGDKAE
jgi:anti-sigma regulatory factor (Ser/Thr protein kinase)